MHIEIGRRSDFDSKALDAMHRLRAKVFKCKKSWDVQVIDGMEIDGFDTLDPFYLIARYDVNHDYVCGCWRVLPTTGPNMLAHIFPELLHGQPAPRSSLVWELSRFVLESPEHSEHAFSRATVRTILAIVIFAIDNGVEQLVTVTTVGVEKMLIRLGLDVNRFGSPIKIGVERAVALRIELNNKTCSSLLDSVISLERGAPKRVQNRCLKSPSFQLIGESAPQSTLLLGDGFA